MKEQEYLDAIEEGARLIMDRYPGEDATAHTIRLLGELVLGLALVGQSHLNPQEWAPCTGDEHDHDRT